MNSFCVQFLRMAVLLAVFMPNVSGQFVSGRAEKTARDSAGLFLDIRGLKEHYFEGEPIWIAVTFENRTARDTSIIAFGSPYDDGLHFNQEPKCGETASAFIVGVSIGESKFTPLGSLWTIPLPSGTSYSEIVDMTRGATTGFSRRDSWSSIVEPDTFGATAIYSSRHADAVISNQICCRVQHVPDSLSDCWSALLELRKAEYCERLDASKLEEFQGFVATCPGSPWTPSLLAHLLASRTHELTWEYSIHLLTAFPESPCCDIALVELSRICGSENFRNLLNRAVNPPAGSRLELLINQLGSGKVAMPLYRREVRELAERLGGEN